MSKSITSLVLAACLVGFAAADQPSDPKTKEILERYKKLADEVDGAYRAGNYAEAAKKQEAVVEVVRSLFPAAEYPNGHEKLADALSNLGVMY